MYDSQVDKLGTPFIFLEYNCFSMLCWFLLYNKVNQLYVYIISSLLDLPPTPLSHPSRSSQSTELSPLCSPEASHQLSVSHMVVYICQCYSLFIPPSPSPTVFTCLFSTSVSLFLPGNRFICIIFLDSTHMH